MKFALCNASLPGLSFDEQCEMAAQLGFDGMMVSPASVSPQKDATRLEPSYGEYLLETAQFHGLTIAGFHQLLDLTGDIRSAPLVLGSSDDSIRAATVAYLSHLLKICYAMEGSVMVIGSAKERAVPSGQSLDETAESAASLLREVATLAERLGVTLAIDPLPFSETDFITSAREATIFQGLVDHPSCQLQLGTAGLAEELNPETPGTPTPAGVTPSETQIAHYTRELIHFHHERLCHFHIVAEAGLDLLPFALSLREVGYSDWVSITVSPGSESPREIAFETLVQLRKFCGY